MSSKTFLSSIKISVFGFISISLLASLLLVLTPAQPANALVGMVSKLCLNSNDGEVAWPSSTGACPSGFESIKPDSVPTNFKAICLAYVIPGGEDGIYNGVDTNGKISCAKYESDTKNYDNVALINRSQVSGKDLYDLSNVEPTPGINPGTTTTGTGTTGTTKTGTTTTKNGTTTKKTNTSSTSNVNDSGECPDGFASKGPLCIPDNPFGDGDGIAGKGTIGELAAAIISILLGLSGIVAVIMIIIGGYQFMTARGNETQSTNGRKTLVNALIGLAIIIVSYAVVQAITNYLTNR